MKEIIIGSVLCIIAAVGFFMSIRAWKEKGFLFNNAYLYASQQEQDDMNKKPYYRQTAIIFLLIGVVFLLNGLAMFLRTSWLSLVAVAVLAVTLVYAIVSSSVIDKKNKQQ